MSRGDVISLVDHHLRLCDERGVSWSEFYRAQVAVQDADPHVSVVDLFDRIWARLALARAGVPGLWVRGGDGA